MLIVTGGAGFIGSALLWKLNQEGRDDIIVVDRMGSGSKWKNLAKRRFIQIIHKDEFLSRLEGDWGRSQHIEGIFHLGASSSTTETDVDYLVRNNIEYSMRLWRYCAEYNIPFIYASSAATYGAGEHGFKDDQKQAAELRPLNPYGFSKQTFDLWALRQTQVPRYWAGLKFFNVYGPQEYHKGSQASVVWHFLPQARNNGVIKLFRSYRSDYPDGEQRRDFVYVKDCVNAIWHLFQVRHKAASGLYNIGSGESRTFLEVADAVFSALAKPARFEFIEMPEALRPQYQYFTEASVDKLKEKGLFDLPLTSLEEGVADYVKKHLIQEDMYL